jgi:hypothetical protein
VEGIGQSQACKRECSRCRGGGVSHANEGLVGVEGAESGGSGSVKYISNNIRTSNNIKLIL